MRVKQTKLITVPANGQISIGKSWAGRQILVEEVGNNEIHISSGTFVPDSQKTYYSKEAKESLDLFNKWEENKPAKATNTKELFASLRRKK